MMSKRRSILILLIFILIFVVSSCRKETTSFTQTFDYTDLSVRDYTSENGMVTAANPLAAKVGLDVLMKGGNAFDAGVAVSMALGVSEMDASGIGGGGMMMAYKAKTKEALFYDFREFASIDTKEDLSYYENMGTSYSMFTATPTLLAGLNQILKDEGTLSLSEVLAPSILLAKEGITLTPELVDNINDSSFKLSLNEYLKSTFRKENGSRLKVGDILVQKDLASTLEKIAEKGIAYFYTGELGNSIVKTVNDHGGVLTTNDMERALNKNYQQDSYLNGTYKDYEILTVGSPSTGGVMLLEMLNMLESYSGEIAELGHNSGEYINLISTAMSLAYGDKEKYLGDANFVDIPLEGLLSKEYARNRFTKYKKGEAYLGTAISKDEEAYGDPSSYMTQNGKTYEIGEAQSHDSTTSFSIIDKEGNMVTITQTINNLFGSGISPEGSGFFLNDEMKDFSFTLGSANVIEPLKEPASYMVPTIVLKNDLPFATFGTPGGSRIPSTALQIFLNITEFKMNMEEAIEAYRIHCFTTSENNRSDESKLIFLENGLLPLKEELESYKYKTFYYGDQKLDSYFGGVQGIKIEDGKYHGASDLRRDGKAFGY